MANPKTQVQVLRKEKCYLRHGTLDAFNCRFVKWRFTEKKKKKRSYMRQTSRGHLVLCLKAESTNLSFLPDAYLTCSENSPEILRLP